MAITKEIFGTLENGEKVYLYKLDNGKNLSAEILSYGGIVKNLYVNKNGQQIDVVHGRDTLLQYLDNKGCFGAAIGRHANRIKNAEFEINGKTYKLAKNNGENSIHGGVVGFGKKNWESEAAGTYDEPAVVMSLFSPDGDEGFPGNLNVKMTYTLTKENALKIHYEAISDEETVVNLTNHSYFNLNGHDSGSIYEHTLWIDSDFYTPNTSECLPCGEIRSVEGTPFDFRKQKKIKDLIFSDFEQIKMFGGYDHNFVLNKRGYKKFATLKGDKSEIVMEIYTNKPGVQIYSANSIHEETICKNGVQYKKHSGICLETQFFPNSTACAHFPDVFLKKGEKYDYTTEYRFVEE